MKKCLTLFMPVMLMAVVTVFGQTTEKTTETQKNVIVQEIQKSGDVQVSDIKSDENVMSRSEVELKEETKTTSTEKKTCTGSEKKSCYSSKTSADKKSCCSSKTGTADQKSGCSGHGNTKTSAIDDTKSETPKK